MKKFPPLFLNSLILTISISLPVFGTDLPKEQQLSGQEIMQRQDEKNRGYHNQTSKGKMLLLGSDGKVKVERKFLFWILEKTDREGSKSLIKILQPADIAGTGLLSIQQKEESNDQWLYLPALKKTKRIAGDSCSRSFLGSELSYEDFIPSAIDKYEYQYLGDKSCDLIECYMVEAKPRSDESVYPKKIILIRKDNLQNYQIQFYNRFDEVEKESIFEHYVLIDNKYWRAFEIMMRNLKNGKSTRIVHEKIELNTNLSDAIFSTSFLER